MGKIHASAGFQRAVQGVDQVYDSAEPVQHHMYHHNLLLCHNPERRRPSRPHHALRLCGCVNICHTFLDLLRDHYGHTDGGRDFGDLDVNRERKLYKSAEPAETLYKQAREGN